MADVSKITYGSNTWNIKDATARSGLAGKQDAFTAGTALAFSGTVLNASLATDSTVGVVKPDNTTIIVDSFGMLTAIGGGGGGGGAEVQTAQVTIATSDWSNKSCTKTVTGVTTSNNIIIASDPSTRSVYNTAGVYAASQANSSITFGCDKTPTASVVVNIMILEVLENADAISY